MFIAELICSDDSCELEVETVGDLLELEALVCDGCGCCLQIVSISGVELVEPVRPFELALAA